MDEVTSCPPYLDLIWAWEAESTTSKSSSRINDAAGVMLMVLLIIAGVIMLLHIRLVRHSFAAEQDRKETFLPCLK